MKTALFVFKAENGKPKFAELSEIRFREHLKNHEGKVYEIFIRESKRSLSQNRLFWAWLEYVESQTGNSAHDLNEYFKRTCLPPKFITVLGKELKVPRSTTDLNKNEFSEFLDKCSALCGIELLDPSEAGYISN